ncbi:MAG TPA: hypothetical protein VHL78_11000 [Actinomycetota bacterium]|nr:hypothetical protein [Actinomycetota bacterium]
MRPLAAIVLAVALLTTACSAGRAGPSPAASPTGDPELWRRDADEPYPFTTPIPPLTDTPIDGTYERSLTPTQSTGPAIPCRRCAPYRRDRGLAVLELRAGRFLLVQEASAFRAGGHYLVEGDRVVLFNDPTCSDVRGVYRWSLSAGQLSLEVVDDPCAYDDLRARYFSIAPWESRAA